MAGVSGLDQDDIRRDEKTGSHSEYTLKMTSIGFNDGLDKGVQGQTQDRVLST